MTPRKLFATNITDERAALLTNLAMRRRVLHYLPAFDAGFWRDRRVRKALCIKKQGVLRPELIVCFGMTRLA